MSGPSVDVEVKDAKDGGYSDKDEPQSSASSCFCCAPSSRVRVACLELLESRTWHYFIRFWAVTNCLALAWEAGRVGYEATTWIDVVLLVYNAACALVFVFEFAVKCVANGFLPRTSDSAYLRDAANWVDLFVVIVK